MASNESKGRLLPFDRTANEVRNLALRHLAQGRPLQAVELLRISLAKAPNDPATILTQAEAYASLGCWVLSNRAYSQLLYHDTYAASGYFGMGENFSQMQQFGTAHDCYTLSLQKDADTDFAPDVVDRLEAIEEAQWEPDVVQARQKRRMARVMRAMDAGKATLATRLIKRVLALDHSNSGIHAMHAFALLAAGEAKEALHAARKACRLDPSDLRAVCALASALKAVGSMDAARKRLDDASTMVSGTSDAQLVCQTACEMGEHAYAASILRRGEEHEPYNPGVLHMLASALHNSGEPEEARQRWNLLRRIDPMDTVADYRLRQSEAETLPEEVPYTRQVPLSEILQRLERLRLWVHEGPDAVQQRWQEDDTLEALLRWGLTCAEPGIPQAMCGILSTLGGARAQALLREVLMDTDAPSDLKHGALAALHTMGVKGPFYAILDDRVNLVHVSKPAQSEDGGQAQRADQLQQLALEWLHIDSRGKAQTTLRALCEIAAGLDDDTLRVSQQARAVVLSFCLLHGMQSPFSSTYSKRRKVARLATRIMKEASDAVH